MCFSCSLRAGASSPSVAVAWGWCGVAEVLLRLPGQGERSRQVWELWLIKEGFGKMGEDE